jgi:nucleoside phosphorylase/tetratricopeptide (TPR) repeat protein
MSQRPSRREDFEIAIICALPLEFNAVTLLFDDFWDIDGDTFGKAAGDWNHYTTGRIGRHDVVLALLSHMGKANAASAAANMRSSYGALRLVILAGVCGGVPHNGKDDIFLGDVVISSSVIQYDFGRHYPNGFMRKNTPEDNLRKHDKNISNLLNKFRTNIGQDKLHERSAHFLKQLQENYTKHREKYRYPGIDKDKLFESSYRHKHRNSAACICRNCYGRKDPVCDDALVLSCDKLDCDEEYLVERSRTNKERDAAQRPAIYIGVVASGDTVMKSGEDRDSIAKKEGVIAFEMEGAGAWDDLPCIVVKGICDYADCHKNKLWQDFAAAAAASVSKAILEQYIQTDKRRESPVKEPPKAHFLVPFGRNQNFVGRQAVLSRLLEKIQPDGNKEDCQRTVIEGLGGVGKTQIALEAVYLLHNEHPGCSIFWVPAVDATSFENAYRNIGKHLNIKGIDQDKADIKLLVKAALSEESSGSWLLVVDNVDDVTLLFGDTEISSYLPFNRNGSILFTTRNHEAAVRLDILAECSFRVTEMEQNEALSLLQKGLSESQTSNLEATEKLLDVLANLPLAIRQASAYMARKHISTKDYLELCQSNPQDMVSLLSKDFEDRHRYKEIQNPVATTWLISFNQILHNDPLAAEYLQFMSILLEKDIPKFLLPTSTKLEAVDAIGTLKGYAFVTQQEEEDSFEIHRLVRLAMRNWLEKEEKLKEMVASVIQRLNEVMPFTKHDNRKTWTRCLPHAQAILELPEYLTGTQEESLLFFNVARGNNHLGRYRIAERMYRQSLEFDEKMLGKEHPDTLAGMSNLGRVLRHRGKFEEAEKLHRHVFEAKEKLLGKCHLDTLHGMGTLVNTVIEQGKYEEAEKLCQQMLEEQHKLLSEDHPEILKLLRPDSYGRNNGPTG